MKKILTFALITASALSLSACAAITLAPAGDYAVGKGAHVTLDRNWSEMSAIMPNTAKKVKLLTLDGHLLNRLYLTDGLVDGDPLVGPLRREAITPVYRSEMSLTEQVEFVAESVTALEYERVETSRVRPTEVSGQRGARFDIAARTKQGLDVRGVGQVVAKNDKLFVAIYLAPAEHYYGAGLASAEAAMSSFRL
jgi:hypothetical protein